MKIFLIISSICSCLFLLIGFSLFHSSYPIIIKEIEKPKEDFAFHVSKRCTHILVIELPYSVLKELGVFSEKTHKIELPITMDVALKDNGKKILFSKENLSFSYYYMTNGEAEMYNYGFKIPLDILEKGDYFISMNSNFSTDYQDFIKSSVHIEHTCKSLF